MNLSWRADVTHSELETYGRLKRAKVKHVATAVAGGDVGDHQVTRSQELMSLQNHRTAKAAKRILLRFVVWEVGRRLETYEDSIHLFRTVYDAFTGSFMSLPAEPCMLTIPHLLTLLAHRMAYKYANILHRDVSMANILIDIHTNRGFLNDWDLCKYTSELHLAQSQDGRSVRRSSFVGWGN